MDDVVLVRTVFKFCPILWQLFLEDGLCRKELTGPLVSAPVLTPTERSRTVLALVLPLRGVRGLCAGGGQGR